jgi:hypothetical protein
MCTTDYSGLSLLEVRCRLIVSCFYLRLKLTNEHNGIQCSAVIFSSAVGDTG